MNTKINQLSVRKGGRIRAIASAISYTGKRLLRFPQTPLDKAAERSFIICLGGVVPAINPFVMESHLPRIRGAATYGAAQVIEQDLNRKMFNFRPVVGYWLRDSVLLNGSVYANGYRHELRSRYERKLRIGLDISGTASKIERAVMVSTSVGSSWWGHWIEDEAPLQLLAEQLATPVAFMRPSYRDENIYRQAFAISDPQKFNIACFDKLLIIDEFAQNPSKTKRYRQLRSRLALLGIGHERVYLRRGTSGVRRMLVNESDVMQRLESMGFKTVDISSSTANDVISACRGASIVVSIEGSHLAPLLYLIKDYGSLVILNPPFQVHTTVADIGVFCGLSTGMFICQPDGESVTDFRVEPDELACFIDETIAFGVKNTPKLEKFLEQVINMDTSDYYFD